MKRLALVIGGLFLMAESAFAIVDFQVLYNFRMMQEAQEGTDAEVRSRPAILGAKVAIHTNPLPIVPVALGLTIMPISVFAEDKDNAKFTGVKEQEMLEVGVEMMAWLPMVPVVRPYMKLGFDFLGKKTEKAEGVEKATELKYMSLTSALGLKYALPMLPMLGFLLEGTVAAKRFYSDDDSADKLLQPRIDALNEKWLPYFGGSAGVEVAI